MFREAEVIADKSIFYNGPVLKSVNVIFYHLLISSVSQHLGALGKEGERCHVQFAPRQLFPYEESSFFTKCVFGNVYFNHLL